MRWVESLARAAEVVLRTRGRPAHRTTSRRKDDLAGFSSGVLTEVVSDRCGVVGRGANARDVARDIPLRGQVRLLDPRQPEPPHRLAQPTPGHQVPAALGVSQEDRLDAAPGHLAAGPVGDREDAGVRQRLLDAAQHDRGGSVSYTHLTLPTKRIV